MRKSFVCLSLVLILMLGAVSAYAVPSKTTADLTSVEALEATNGATIGSDFVLDVSGSNPTVDQELARIAEFVMHNNSPVVDYFPADVRAQIQAKLPAGVDIEKLSLNEFVALAVENFDSAYGNMIASFSFATQYRDGQPIVAVVGLYADGSADVEWVVLSAEVVGGLVKVYFTEDVLSRISEGTSASLAILSMDE